MVVVGKHSFYMFAYCGVVGNPHLTASILYFLLPFQRQPSFGGIPFFWGSPIGWMALLGVTAVLISLNPGIPLKEAIGWMVCRGRGCSHLKFIVVCPSARSVPLHGDQSLVCWRFSASPVCGVLVGCHAQKLSEQDMPDVSGLFYALNPG